MSNERITSFTKLDTWQQSHRLVVAIFEIYNKLPRSDSLRNQTERSAVSITSNIAEGFGRQSLQDKKHFYIMARGSAYELQNQLLIARDTKKISQEDFQRLSILSLDSLRLLHGLIRSLTNAKNANS